MVLPAKMWISSMGNEVSTIETNLKHIQWHKYVAKVLAQGVEIWRALNNFGKWTEYQDWSKVIKFMIISDKGYYEY